MNSRTVTWAAIAIAAFGFAAWRGYVQFGPETANAHLPADFPNAYLAPADDGKVEAAVIRHGRVPPPMIDDDGTARWPAWVCGNPACVDAHGGHPFVFAKGHAPAASPPPSSVCPACAKAGRDPLRIAMWFTPEAAAILADINDRLSPESKPAP